MLLYCSVLLSNCERLFSPFVLCRFVSPLWYRRIRGRRERIEEGVFPGYPRQRKEGTGTGTGRIIREWHREGERGVLCCRTQADRHTHTHTQAACVRAITTALLLLPPPCLFLPFPLPPYFWYVHCCDHSDPSETWDLFTAAAACLVVVVVACQSIKCFPCVTPVTVLCF